MRIQNNLLTEAIGRDHYAFFDYNTKKTWGEEAPEGLMPVMTYSGFGSEIRNNNPDFNYFAYDYIICDEM